MDAFFHSLADYIKDELVSHELPSTLDEAIALAVRIDRRMLCAKIHQPPAFGEIRLGSCHLLLLNQASLISLSPWKLGEPLSLLQSASAASPQTSASIVEVMDIEL